MMYCRLQSKVPIIKRTLLTSVLYFKQLKPKIEKDIQNIITSLCKTLLLTCASSSISLGPATEPGSAVSLLTYQVRLEAGTEAGERHEAVTVSPTEYLGQRSYLDLATDLREEPTTSRGTVKLREGSVDISFA